MLHHNGRTIRAAANRLAALEAFQMQYEVIPAPRRGPGEESPQSVFIITTTASEVQAAREHLSDSLHLLFLLLLASVSSSSSSQQRLHLWGTQSGTVTGGLPGPQVSVVGAPACTRVLLTSRPPDLKSSRPQDFKTSRPQDLKTSRPPDLKTSMLTVGHRQRRRSLPEARPSIDLPLPVGSSRGARPCYLVPGSSSRRFKRSPMSDGARERDADAVRGRNRAQTSVNQIRGDHCHYLTM
ncbi:unnamed protein product [Gadus morhua 'NCC']